MTVTILALAEEHVPHILAACQDWEELAQYGPPYWRPRSSAQLHRKIAATSGPNLATDYNFVIADEGRLVGECSLHAINWRSRHGEVGICIWNPLDRGKGYGRAGVEHIIHWAQDHLNLHRLEAWILADNIASQGLFARLGFTHEGTLQQRYFHDGIHKDVHVYGRILTGQAH